MAALESVVEQALQLTDDERGEVIARLLRSLEPDDGDELSGEEWEAAWSAELDRRVREVRDGSVELVDGDQAPYAIVFLDHPAIVVVAVAHQRRRPGYWFQRLGP